MAPFTEEVQETRYLAFYEISTGITVWRHLRKKCRKHGISPFTREVQEITSPSLSERGKKRSRTREAEERFDDPNIT